MTTQLNILTDKARQAAEAGMAYEDVEALSLSCDVESRAEAEREAGGRPWCFSGPGESRESIGAKLTTLAFQF